MGAEGNGDEVKKSLETAYQQLKEKYGTKSEFVSLVVHQLRTPLSALKWSIKMLLDGDLGTITAEQRNVLLKAYNSNSRMIQLVNDILSVERIEAGEMRYEFGEVNVAALLDELMAEFEHIAREGGVILELEKASGHLLLEGDKEKLRVVFQNLIDNAIKYSVKGGSVHLKARAEGDKVVVDVADSGIGIPEDEQKRLFLKFYRTSSAVKVRTEGSGLGLFITKVIVEGHKGSVSFMSKPGKGTTFTVTLPVKQGGDPSK